MVSAACCRVHSGDANTTSVGAVLRAELSVGVLPGAE